MRGKLGIVGGIVALLVTVTVVWAAYTGPIRPRQVTQTIGWVRTIYRNNPWQRECQCGMSGPGERCGDNDYNCFCGQSPYNNSSLYTCYEDPVTKTVTHNPATASGSYACGTPGNNGWCRGGASLNVSGSEPVSGYSITRLEGNYDGSNTAAVSCGGASCAFTPPQGAGTFWYWAVSSYGDTSAKSSLTYKVDTIPPSVSLSPSGTTGNNSWYVSPVVVSASGTDATSGLATLTLSCGSNPCTVAAEGATTLTASATDVAGNAASQNLTVRVDTVPPTPLITLSGTSGKNGWYTSSVTATAGGNDATSGVASAEVQLDGGGWGSTAQVGEGVHTLTFRAADVAGNASGEQSQVVRVDTTPPAVAVLLPVPDGNNGWYRSSVRVNGDASDTGSGMADLRGQVNHGGWQSLPFSLDSDGVYQVTLEGEDVAGNTRQRSAEVKLDSQPPALSAGLSGTPGNNGWYVSEVQASPTASDLLSGMASARWRADGGSWMSTPLLLTDGVHVLELEGEDVAGNSATLQQVVRVDTTPPQTAFAVSGKEGRNGWYRSPAAVAVQAVDATSGVDQVVLEVNGAATNETQTTLEDGVYQVSAYSVDAAGLVSETAALTVQVDTTPPQAAFGDFPARLSRTVELTGSAADGTSGLQAVELSLDGGQTWETLTVVNGEWRTTWDTTTVRGGDHTLLLHVLDAAGNETTISRTVRVANRAPSAWVTASWPVWESGQVDVNAGDLPVARVCITIRDPQNRWPEVENCYDSLSDVPREVKWDRRFADGTRAPAGSYSVQVEVTDILGQRGVAQGEIVVPLVALLLPQPSATPTPTPTLTPTTAATRADTPTREATAFVPTATPTLTATPTHIAAQAAAEVSRPLWPFLTMLGLTLALGTSAVRDRRPEAIRKLAERINQLQEVK